MKSLPTLLGGLLLLAAHLPAQQFGYSVAIDDGRIYVAEPSSFDWPSRLHVYAPAGSGWDRVSILEPELPADAGFMNSFGAGLGWGAFVAAAEGTLVVGAPAYQQGLGGVWVYRWVGAEWQLVQLLQVDGIGERAQFGSSGILHEDRLFLSAPFAHEGQGGVWLFERGADGLFAERTSIRQGNPAPRETFGGSLAFDGARLLVGSAGDAARTGAAYVFVSDTDGLWRQQARLAPLEGEGARGDVGLGATVGWLGATALVGIMNRSEGRGAVLTFRQAREAGTWERDVTLAPDDLPAGARFGDVLLPTEDELLVSAPGWPNAVGSLYRFPYDATTGELGPATKIVAPPGTEAWDSFGSSLAMGGGLLVVGAPDEDNRLGSVTLFRDSGSGWVVEDKLLVEGPPAPPAIAGGAVTCDATGAAAGYPCAQVDVLAFLPIDALGGERGTIMNDLWGWTDPETGHEYALVGRSDGTAFVDVTDPSSPSYVGELPRTDSSPPSMWRDIKVFRDHAFIVADGAGAHGMQVFDLRRLREAGPSLTLFEPDAIYEGFGSAHNIAINEETGTAYAIGANSGGNPCGGGLHMIDIGDPLQPSFLGCFSEGSGPAAGGGFAHDAMCVVYRGPDDRYQGREICFSSNGNELAIVDVTQKETPVAVAFADYPSVAYAHQGWISDDHRYFYMNDEGDEIEADPGSARLMPGTRTLIWDIAELDDPILAAEHFGQAASVDHNLYIRGDLMYQSNYTSGLRILSISDPIRPVEVGFFDTLPSDDERRFSGSWSNYPFFESGTIAVTSIGEGLFLLRFRPPAL